tara:strand:- start:935 stop:1726 length:792 start_codon:yes stop_codon:yes gene_type:complete
MILNKLNFIKRFFRYIVHNSNYINDIHILKTKFRRFSKIKNIDKSWIDKPKGASGIDFFNWFDSAENIKQVLKLAERDFNYAINPYLPIDKTKTILEIGFGGGRLALQACKKAKFYLGIDIHDNFEETKNFLNSNGVSNFKMFNLSELKKIPKFDLVYSFIVIQHFSNIKILELYLDFISKKLNSNGKVILWYGKLKTKLFGEYYEVPPSQFRERECSLFITKEKMELMLQKMNFRIIKHSIDNKTPDLKRKSMQSFVIFERI